MSTLKFRKYPNRRIYDLRDRSYVSLSHVQALIEAGHDVVIHEQRTQKNITRDVLFDVLRRKESVTQSLSTTILTKLIREGQPAMIDMYIAERERGESAGSQFG